MAYSSALLWMVPCFICYALGEWLSKHYAITPTPLMGTLVVLAYSLGAFFWLPAIQRMQTLSIIGTVWCILSLVTTLSIGLFVFNEHLSICQWFGIGLSFVVIVLLSL